MVTRWLNISLCFALAAGSAPVRAEGSRFVPGLYETESRSSASPARGERHTECNRAADVDSFRRETIARLLKAPQFRAVCRLSEPKLLANGFALAMDCGEARTLTTFAFARDLVRSVTLTHVRTRPDNSSEVITLSRRIGECSRQAP